MTPLIRLYMKARRRILKIGRFFGLTGAEVLVNFFNIPAAMITFLYSVFYYRHFYLRLSGVNRNPRLVQRAQLYPYILSPFQYIIVVFAIISILKILGLPVFRELPELSRTWFILEILLYAALALPFALITIITLIVAVTVFKYMAQSLALISPGFQVVAEIWQINWGFLRMVSQRRFWVNYRHREILPCLIYYSISLLALIPIAVNIFAVGFDLVILLIATLDLTGSRYADIANTLMLVVVFLIGIACLYYLVARPLLVAIVFRSNFPLVRQGVFPELLVSGKAPDTGEESNEGAAEGSVESKPKRTEVFLDANLEETLRGLAVFVLSSTVDTEGRIIDRQILPPKKERSG